MLEGGRSKTYLRPLFVPAASSADDFFECHRGFSGVDPRGGSSGLGKPGGWVKVGACRWDHRLPWPLPAGNEQRMIS